MIKKQQILPIIIFLLSWAFFLKGLSPSVYVGDNGDFMAAAATLGIAHPTGYPTFLLLAKIFSFLPLGEVAYRLNLLSAFMGGLTLLSLFLFVTFLFNNWLAALASTLIMLGSVTLYSQSVILEVYTLNAWLIIMTSWISTLFIRSNSRRLFFLVVLFASLGITNHLLIVLTFPALFYLGFNKLKNITVSRIFMVIFIFVLIYGINLYLPLRSANNPSHQWTELTNINGLAEHLNGAQYKHRMFNLTIKQFQENIKIFFNLYSREFTPFLLIFILFGLYYLKDLNIKYLLFFLLIIGFNFLYNLNYYIPLEIRVYYLPASMFLAILIGFGINKLERIAIRCNLFATGQLKFLQGVIGGRFFSKKSPPNKIYTWLHFALSNLIPNNYLRAVICLSLAFLPLFFNFTRESRRVHYYANDLGANIMRILPANSVLFVEDDSSLLSLSYHLKALSKRRDIRVINRVGTLFEDFYSFRRDKSMRDINIRRMKELYFIKNNFPKTAIFSNVKLDIPGNLTLHRKGFLYQIGKKNKRPEKILPYLRFRKTPRFTHDLMTRMIINGYRGVK